MKIYEKPMAIVNKFEVADVIAASKLESADLSTYMTDTDAAAVESTTQGVLFQW